jgi:hypothetical protein
MKIGMNLLLWATHVTELYYPQLEKIKATGFDGIEIPSFGGYDAFAGKRYATSAAPVIDP